MASVGTREASVLAGNCLPAGMVAAIIAYFAALTFHLKLLSDNRIAGSTQRREREEEGIVGVGERLNQLN